MRPRGAALRRQCTPKAPAATRRRMPTKPKGLARHVPHPPPCSAAFRALTATRVQQGRGRSTVQHGRTWWCRTPSCICHPHGPRAPRTRRPELRVLGWHARMSPEAALMHATLTAFIRLVVTLEPEHRGTEYPGGQGGGGACKHVRTCVRSADLSLLPARHAHISPVPCITCATYDLCHTSPVPYIIHTSPVPHINCAIHHLCLISPVPYITCALYQLCHTSPVPRRVWPYL